MKLVLAAALLATVALAASACGSGHRADSGTVTSSRFILGGTVRCTATLPSSVQIGHELGVTVSFRNVTSHAVHVQPAYGGIWVLVKSPDGTTYDTRVPLENSLGPPPRPIALRPGAVATSHLLQVLRVRWQGPLRVTPGCDVSAAPSIRVTVTSPGPPASTTAAFDDVVAATGHLFDHCRPTGPGASVVGRIDAPRRSAPPMRARCSITVRHERSFDLAQALVITPPSLRGIRVNEPYEALPWFPGAGNTTINAEAIAWQFVVTRDGATSVDSTSVESAKAGSGLMAPDWQWTSSGWTGRPGGSRCGHTGGGGGGYVGPYVEFVSACR